MKFHTQGLTTYNITLLILWFDRNSIYSRFSASTYSYSAYYHLKRMQLLGQEYALWWKYIGVCYQIARIIRWNVLTWLYKRGSLCKYPLCLFSGLKIQDIFIASQMELVGNIVLSYNVNNCSTSSTKVVILLDCALLYFGGFITYLLFIWTKTDYQQVAKFLIIYTCWLMNSTKYIQ